MKELIQYWPALGLRRDLDRRVLSLSGVLSGLLVVFGLENLPVTAEGAEPSRGIAVLASDIGQAYPVTALQEFLVQGAFSSVIIDWAWITYHWDRTDFAAVRDLRPTCVRLVLCRSDQHTNWHETDGMSEVRCVCFSILRFSASICPRLR